MKQFANIAVLDGAQDSKEVASVLTDKAARAVERLFKSQCMMSYREKDGRKIYVINWKGMWK